MVRITENIWAVPDFLPKKECLNLIAFSEAQGYEEAGVRLPDQTKVMKGIRNNLRLEYCNQDLADRLFLAAKQYLPEQSGWKPLALSPYFRFYKYEIGQRFKKHRDGVVQDGDMESRITFMIYLNDDFEGGHTQFEDAIAPVQTGTLLCFLHELKHESLPVTNGTKYVLRTNVMGRIVA